MDYVMATIVLLIASGLLLFTVMYQWAQNHELKDKIKELEIKTSTDSPN